MKNINVCAYMSPDARKDVTAHANAFRQANPLTMGYRVLWAEAFRGEAEACDHVAVYGVEDADRQADFRATYEPRGVKVEFFDAEPEGAEVEAEDDDAPAPAKRGRKPAADKPPIV